nr:MAG TPA: hypothetical protein [Caudoviricetes sp.]
MCLIILLLLNVSVEKCYNFTINIKSNFLYNTTMEIKLSAGDKIQIPTGCKATIEENTIIIEEQKEEFKDGDILYTDLSGNILIFKSYERNRPSFESYFNIKGVGNFYWNPVYFRHATEEEKQAFFDELKEQGLHWNPEAKKMERIRWRVRAHTEYFYINDLGEVDTCEDWGEGSHDDEYYNLGNYYLPHERVQAEEDAKAIKAIFEKRLKVK